MFAGAGILWGAVTVFRGVQTWSHEKAKAPFPAMIALGSLLALTCLGYLVWRI